MSALYSYLTSEEHYLDSISAVTESKLMHLDLAFEQFMMEHEYKLSLIETKVLMECGTDEDLTMLYLAEAEEAQEKGKGIISSIIDAIRKFLKRVKEFLFGKDVDEKNLPKEVEVPANPDNVISEGRSISTNILNFLKGNKTGLTKALVATAATGAAILAGTKVKQTYDNLKEYVKQQEQQIENIENSAENANLTPEDQSIVKKALNRLHSNINEAIKIFKAIPKIGSDEYNKAKEDLRDNKNQEKVDKATANKNAAETNASNIDQQIAATKAKIKELKAYKRKLGGFLKEFKDLDAKKIEKLEKNQMFLSDKEKKILYKKREKNGQYKVEVERIDALIDKLNKSLDILLNQKKKANEKIDKAASKELDAKLKQQGDSQHRVTGASSVESLLAQADNILGKEKSSKDDKADKSEEGATTESSFEDFYNYLDTIICD